MTTAVWKIEARLSPMTRKVACWIEKSPLMKWLEFFLPPEESANQVGKRENRQGRENSKCKEPGAGMSLPTVTSGKERNPVKLR
jgi:hypothetical protein